MSLINTGNAACGRNIPVGDVGLKYAEHFLSRPPRPLEMTVKDGAIEQQ